MCGRSRCALAPEQVEQAAGVQRERWVDRERYRPSYNVSPGAWTPIIRLDEENAPQLQTMRWGLVPSFTKHGDKPDFYKMFNARSESVSEKPIFSRLLKRQRCVVLLDGFYEWKTDAGGKKQPYYCNFGEGSVMKMAGLYDVWAGGSEGPLTTYTILTTDAAPRLRWLHNRMPVILPDDAAVTSWLGSGSKPPGTEVGSSPQQQQQQQQQQEEEDLQQGSEITDSAVHANEGKAESGVKERGTFSLKELEQLCQPFNGDALMWHPVTPAMSKPSYNNPDASKDMRTKKSSISTFFKADGRAATAAAAPKGSPVKGSDAAAGRKDVAAEGAKRKGAAAAAEGEETGQQKQQQQQQQGKLTKQEPQHDHHQKSQQQQKSPQQQKVTKGTINNFFKPVTSPAKQQQQQFADSAVRNPDEEPGPSAEDNAVARKVAEQESGIKRHSEDSKMETHSKKARGRAA